MQIKQGDLFWEMDREFVKGAMEIAEKIEVGADKMLFRDGDAADHFYVLIKGRVLLNLGETGPRVHMAANAGEIIGWSSLIGRERYSASARCLGPAVLLKFHRNKFLELLAQSATSEALLFRRLAQMLGQRLLEIYPALS